MLPCLFIPLSDCGGLESSHSSPPTRSCVLTACLCVTWRSFQVSQKLSVPGQHLHPQLKCDFTVRKTGFSSCSAAALPPPPAYPKSTADPAGYPGVKLAVLNQLTVWSAAWWCHLAALCPWLSDCILYPGPTGRAGSHPLSSYLRRQRENLAGTTLPAG